jgi:hypothetical protein
MFSHRHNWNLRSIGGQTDTAFNIALACLVIFVIAALTWELALLLLARQQLRTEFEAAVLANKRALASCGNPSYQLLLTPASDPLVATHRRR